MNNVVDNRQIKVFVSSTFSDLRDERSSLTYKIFPAKRYLCEKKGYDFIDIDLRWGVSAREAANGDVLEICLTEIDNTKPFFLGIIGDRYGWIPMRKDVNDVEKLVEAFPRIDTYLDCAYSITEMEMMFGVLDCDKDYNAVFFIRKPLSESNSEDDKKLELLRQKIRSQGKYPVFEYETIEEFEDVVDDFFTRQLGEICVEYLDTKSEYENMHRQFTAILLRNYLPYAHYIDTLDIFLANPQRSILKLVGKNGCGKSSLVAYYCSLINSRGGKWHAIVYHNEAVIDEKGGALSYIRLLLSSILGGWYPEANLSPATTEDEKQLLEQYMDEIEKRGIKLLVILDLANMAIWKYYFDDLVQRRLNNPNIKCILVHESDAYHLDYWDAETDKKYKNRICNDSFFDLDAVQKAAFVEHYFKYFSKTLPYPSLTGDIANSEVSTVLSLVMILDNLRKYGSYDTFGTHLKLLLDKNSSGDLVPYFIEEFMQEFDTGDCAFVKDFFSYLAIDNRFTESDIVSILKIPHDKLYIFYRFFRACSSWYRIIDRYILLNISPNDVFRGEDYYDSRYEEDRYANNIVEHFVNNYDKHPESSRAHLYIARKRALTPYYKEYRWKMLDGTLRDDEVGLCHCLLTAYDLPDGEEYSQNMYMAVKCVDRMVRTGINISRDEGYCREVRNWLNGFYHSLDIDELNDLYCTEEELAEIKKIEEAYDFGEARRRIREISKELEYSKIALRMKALLNM